MKEFLTKWLGPNYGPKILGWLTMLFAAIAGHEELMIEIAGETWGGKLVAICKILVFASGAAFAGTVKGSKVTGGVVPATGEAEQRVCPECFDEHGNRIDPGHHDEIPTLEGVDHEPLVLKKRQ